MNGHIYVVEFTGDIIKVGFATDPDVRLRTHASDGAAFGHIVKRSWISPRHSRADASEWKLIEFCVERCAQRRRSEYFSGLSFEEVTGFAASFDFCIPAPEAPVSRDSGREQRKAILDSADLSRVNQILALLDVTAKPESWDLVRRSILAVYDATVILDHPERRAIRMRDAFDIVVELAKNGHLVINGNGVSE